MKSKAYLALIAVAALSVPLIVLAQDAPPERGAMAGVRSIRGTVTATAPPLITIKTEQGETWQVKLGPNARIVKGGLRGEGGGMRGGPGGDHSQQQGRQRSESGGENRGENADRQPPQTIAISDIHVGDMLSAGGDVDDSAKKVNAVFGMVIDAATVKKLEADWGVTYIAGKVTAIDADNAKITVQRPDGKSATIQADESTSFRKGHDNITLADIKAGDTITARGAQKNGIFTPNTLVVFDPNARRGPRNPNNNAPSPNP